MSYGARPIVIPATPSQKPVTATAAQIGAVVGAAATACTLVAVNGVLVMAEGLRGVGEIARHAVRDTSAAQGSAATLLAYPTGLNAETLPMFREGLEARRVRFAEGGSLQLADGQTWDMVYTALDQRNRVRFFVHTANDGRVELLVQDQEAMAAVEDVVVETLIALAVETLSQQGFHLQRQGVNRWTMERRAADGITEQVVFGYHNGRLTTEAISRDQQGTTLYGNDCPNLSAFTAFFREPEFSALSGKTLRRTGSSGRTARRVRVGRRLPGDQASR